MWPKAIALGADAVSLGTRGADRHRRQRPSPRRACIENWVRRLAFGRTSRRAPIRRESPRRILPWRAASIRELAGRRLANYLQVLTLELQTLARANGKSHVHNLEPEDLAALTVEAAAMAKVAVGGYGVDPRQFLTEAN